MFEMVLGLLAAVGVVALADRVVRALVAREMRDVPRCVYVRSTGRLFCLADRAK